MYAKNLPGFKSMSTMDDIGHAWTDKVMQMCKRLPRKKMTVQSGFQNNPTSHM